MTRWIVIAALPLASCSTTTSAAARLHDALPIVAESVRELCKSSGDAIIDAYEAQALSADVAAAKLARVHSACRDLGAGLALIDGASAKLGGD